MSDLGRRTLRSIISIGKVISERTPGASVRVRDSEVSLVWRWGLVITIFMAGCLPEAIVDPANCRIDPALEGTWLAEGLALSQCEHDSVEYGPGVQRSLYLVAAFDERCYLITGLDYYLADDGRLGLFGPGQGAAFTQWRGWLASIGQRQYLICHEIEPSVPADPDVVVSPGAFFPTFEVNRIGDDAVRLTPVVFADMCQRLGEAISAEEYARRLGEFPREQVIERIKADPDAAAPGDPAPVVFNRMQPSTESHVQRVLEAFHIVDPLYRPARPNSPDDGGGK
jgi:hypothetical protein